MPIYNSTTTSSHGGTGWISTLLVWIVLVHTIAAQTTPPPTTTTISSYLVILKLSGRPSALTNSTQIVALESQFKKAYSDIENAAWNVKKPPFRRTVSHVDVDELASLGKLAITTTTSTSSLSLPNGSNVTQSFDILCRVNITCRGCQEELRLFSNLTTTTTTNTTTGGGRFSLFSYNPWYGPTPSAFTSVLNRYLKVDRRINGTIDRVIRSQQLENIECADDETILTTATVVDFTGYPTLQTNDQIQILAQGFQDTYNRLNGIGSDTCDTYFRQVTAVTDTSNVLSIPESSNRFLATTTSTTTTSSVKLPFSVIFKVQFRCRGCRTRSTLFANDAVKRDRRRYLLEEVDDPDGNRHPLDSHNQRTNDALRVLQQQQQGGSSLSSSSFLDSDECACRPDAVNQKPRAPTIDEFLVAYNSTVQQLNQKGSVQFATAVDGGLELEPIPCIANVTTQSIVVAMNVRGIQLTSLLTKADTTALANGFVQAYSSVSENGCDAFFRVLERASIIEIVGDTTTTTTSNSSLTPSIFTIYLRVQFSCRGCPRNAKIFHGTTTNGQRQLRNDDGGGHRRRRLVEQSTCYCNRGVTNLNAPTQDEFGFYYKDTISVMNLTTAVTFVSATDSVCPKFFDSCDGTYTNGCETHLRVDTNHCGSCGNVCSGLNALCIDGQCDCDITPFANFTLNGKVGGTTVTDFPKFLDYDTGCGLRFTPDTAIQRASSAFAPITLLNANYSFSMSLSYRIYGDQAGQADGIAFVLHQDRRGVTAVGSAGGGMGVHGIHPALIVEMDTYDNPDLNDEDGRHIHIQVTTTNDVLRQLSQRPVKEIRTDPELIGGLWVDYDGTTIRVYHNVESDKEKPVIPSGMARISLVDLFQDNQLFFGFSAATWNQGDNQDIVAWSFRQ